VNGLVLPAKTEPVTHSRSMKTKTHFQFRLDLRDAAGETFLSTLPDWTISVARSCEYDSESTVSDITTR
jgi:hypothetical protein